MTPTPGAVGPGEAYPAGTEPLPPTPVTEAVPPGAESTGEAGTVGEAYPPAATAPVDAAVEGTVPADAQATVPVDPATQATAPADPAAQATVPAETPAQTIACPVPTEPRFATLLQAQLPIAQILGCPLSDATQTFAAWQAFENQNQLLWLESEDAILALYGGMWHGFEDVFTEADPEILPDAPTPPSPDLIQPIRGFARVWVNVVAEMGFAVAPEVGYDTTVQRFTGGWLISTPYGQVLVLQGMTSAQEGSGPYQSWIEQGDGTWQQP